jgi:hypothetical protein
MSGDSESAGPRWVEVDPARLTGWVARFGDRHGGPTIEVRDGLLLLSAPDGAYAECHPPPGAADLDPDAGLAGLVAVASVPSRLGVLLARRGGYAVGVADGASLVASKVDSRYVQGRTAAGGWSQHRFARRRENQAKAAADDAAAVCARVLMPVVASLTALVTGGDRRAVEAILTDARLAALRPLRAERFLAVPDPKLAVLTAALSSARAVWIRVEN